MNDDQILLIDAEHLTGLPCPLILALASSGEVPGEEMDGEFYIGKSALLAWCRLYAKILAAVVEREKSTQALGGLTARTLVWMNGAGLLTGKDRVRL